jgi:exopolysaccharide biosynthesis polyprenyl glycosylphosphotransferase
MRISKSTHLRRLLQSQDVCFATLAYVVSINLTQWLGYRSLADSMVLIQLTPLVLLLAILASKSSMPPLRSPLFPTQLRFMLRQTSILVGGVLLLCYLVDVKVEMESAAVAFAALLFGGLLADRVFLKWWYLARRRESRINYLKVLVIGAGERAKTLMSRYRNASEWGVDIIGVLDPEPALLGSKVAGVQVLGTLDAIEDVLSHRVVDEVVVCLPRKMLGDLDALVRACETQGVCLKFMADLYEIESGKVNLEQVGATPVLSFEPVPRDEVMLITKRVFDVLLVMLALPVLLPVFVVVALAVKLDSKGPVLFVQDRVGLHKRRFKLLKFRSMHVDAEQRMKEVEHLNEADGPIFKIRNDPRVTRVGRFIRRTSLDELPQLLNVLAGDMSIIGPRPMSVRDVELFSRSIQRRRFSVPPGLACLREISGRSQLSFDRWLELDLKYIDEWCLLLDVKILLKVIPAVLRGHGAS